MHVILHHTSPYCHRVCAEVASSMVYVCVTLTQSYIRHCMCLVSDISLFVSTVCISSNFYVLFPVLQYCLGIYDVPLALKHAMSKLGDRSGDKIELVWWRMTCMSKQYQRENCTSWYCTRSSLSCLLTFYGIPIFHTF